MPAKKRRRTRKGGRRALLGRLWRWGKRLRYAPPLAILIFVVWIILYPFLPPERQRQSQEIALLVIDLGREADFVPVEGKRVLDALADLLPLSRGLVLDTGEFSGADKHFFAGVPEAEFPVTLIENEGYAVGYDEFARNPAWVSFRLFPPTVARLAERPEDFETDARSHVRVEEDAYTGTGFDRGHMAPNRGIGLCYGPEAQMETFLMTNIAPQRPLLNRGLWRELEAHVLDRYGRRLGEVWVTVGPVYDDPPNGLEVARPDAFYKMVLDEHEKGVRALAFLVPQSIGKDDEPEAYLTSIDTIEERTGIDFFSDLPDELETELEQWRGERMW